MYKTYTYKYVSYGRNKNVVEEVRWSSQNICYVAWKPLIIFQSTIGKRWNNIAPEFQN